MLSINLKLMICGKLIKMKSITRVQTKYKKREQIVSSLTQESANLMHMVK
jgi:hypothetical protein